MLSVKILRDASRHYFAIIVRWLFIPLHILPQQCTYSVKVHYLVPYALYFLLVNNIFND